ENTLHFVPGPQEYAAMYVERAEPAEPETFLLCAVALFLQSDRRASTGSNRRARRAVSNTPPEERTTTTTAAVPRTRQLSTLGASRCRDGSRTVPELQACSMATAVRPSATPKRVARTPAPPTRHE